MSLIRNDFTHITVGIDIASSGATNADRFALAVERTDRTGSHIEHVTAQRGLRPTDAVDKVIRLLSVLDASSPDQAGLTVAVDRTGDAGTAEMLETAIRDHPWKHVVKVRRVWITAGDGETSPQKGDKTDPFRTKWSVGRDLLLPTWAKRLRTGELDVAEARGDAADILREEAGGLGMRSSGTNGKKRIDHAKGKHDDVVMASALADWAARGRRIGSHTPPPAPAKAMATPVAGRPAALKPSQQAQKPEPVAPVAAAAAASPTARRNPHGLVIPAWGRQHANMSA